MKRPTVKQARALCEALEARAVIVLALYEEDCAGASYGETKRECEQTGYTMDCIIEDIKNERIPVWTDGRVEYAVKERR